MVIEYSELKKQHPCFGCGPKAAKARMHLPVSPYCNIECRFCDRTLNDYEDRPGVTSEVIRPEEAGELVKRALRLCEDLSVVGIAGPGDTLASGHALETFSLIDKEYPQLIKCMSTNGLLLAEKAEEVIAAGIGSLTVTVNAVDPEIESRLNDGIMYHGEHIVGVEAAAILIKNQLSGIRKVSAAGIVVKVNCVLVPGVNDRHVKEVAETVRKAGACIFNIIPLIPQHRLADFKAPSCAEIDRVRTEAERHIDVFRHCRHCRADAIGIPGETDFGDQIYLKRISGKETFSHG